MGKTLIIKIRSKNDKPDFGIKGTQEKTKLVIRVS